MKKLFIGAIIALSTVSFVACGNTTQANNSANTNDTVTTEVAQEDNSKVEEEAEAKEKAEKETKEKAEAEKKKQNQQAREDYVRVNRRKKVQKVVGEVNKFTKPGTPYKGPTSAFQAQEIQKDKERQKLAKELKNRKIAEQNRRAREKAANINRRQKSRKSLHE